MGFGSNQGLKSFKFGQVSNLACPDRQHIPSRRFEIALVSDVALLVAGHLAGPIIDVTPYLSLAD